MLIKILRNSPVIGCQQKQITDVLLVSKNVSGTNPCVC